MVLSLDEACRILIETPGAIRYDIRFKQLRDIIPSLQPSAPSSDITVDNLATKMVDLDPDQMRAIMQDPIYNRAIAKLLRW